MFQIKKLVRIGKVRRKELLLQGSAAREADGDRLAKSCREMFKSIMVLCKAMCSLSHRTDSRGLTAVDVLLAVSSFHWSVHWPIR
jgi:hypothetical protein